MILWTKLHLLTLIPTLIIFILIGLLSYKYLSKKNEKIKSLPLKVIAILIVIMEIIKQIVSFSNGYNLYHLPFHFCSMFIFLLPLDSLYKGKYKDNVKIFTKGCCAALFLCMLIAPNLIYSDAAISDTFKFYQDFHSVIFHSLVCLYFILSIALTRHTYDYIYDLKVIAIGITIYSFIGSIASQLLATNFNNFYECRWDLIDNFRLMMIDSIGSIGQALYVFGAYLVTLIFSYLAYYLLKLLENFIVRLKIKYDKQWLIGLERWHLCDNKEDADKLFQLVKSGKKVATCYLYKENVNRGESCSVLTNYDGDESVILMTKRIYLKEFISVKEKHAKKEGEGDSSIEYWRKIHHHFFSKILAMENKQFSEDTLLVLEEFKIIK